MNSYIDYNYYSNTFKGKLISKEEFDNLAIRASNKVRNRIFDRDITLFENEVKNATCSVAEILYSQNLNKEKLNNIINGKEKLFTSEKLGDVSRNIGNISINDLKEFISDDYVNNLVEKILYDCLFYTGLLYCGVPYV